MLYEKKTWTILDGFIYMVADLTAPLFIFSLLVNVTNF